MTTRPVTPSTSTPTLISEPPESNASRTQILHYEGLPDFPPLLDHGLKAARVLPGIIMLGLAVTIVSAASPSNLQRWIQASFQFTPIGYAAFAAIFGLASLGWAIFPGKLKRAPLVDFAGAIGLTFPLGFYITAAWFYSVFEAPDTSKAFAWLYTAAFFLLLALYAVEAGLRLWFMDLRRAIARIRDESRREGRRAGLREAPSKGD